MAAVQRVASLYPTAIISGRSREKVYEFVRIPELYYAGSHGLDIVGPTLPASNGCDGSVETREARAHNRPLFSPA
jgi:trehalose 6-phosphate phosphatase